MDRKGFHVQTNVVEHIDFSRQKKCPVIPWNLKGDFRGNAALDWCPHFALSNSVALGKLIPRLLCPIEVAT